MSAFVGSLLIAAAIATGADPAFPISKETTHFTEPLDKDGYVDCEAILNARLGKGIAPEKNAVVLLWKALGPLFDPLDPKELMPAAFSERLGVAALPPPPQGEYFVDLSPFLRNQAEIDRDERFAIAADASTSERPWKAKDHPYIAAWLKANEKLLDIGAQATRLPDYYHPVVARPTKNSSHVQIDFRHTSRLRAIASAWVTRAMLAIEEGRMAAAWQDLLACHRLARLCTRGVPPMDAWVGIALEHLAISGELVYLDRAGLSAAQCRDRLKDLRGLPPLFSFVDAVDFGERCSVLDSVQRAHRGGPESIAKVIEMDFLIRRIGAVFRDSAPNLRKVSDSEKKALAHLDWDAVLRTSTRRYNAFLAVIRIEDRASREQELQRLEKEIKERKTPTPDALLNALGQEGSGKAASVLYGEMLAESAFAGIRATQSSVDRVEQTRRNARRVRSGHLSSRTRPLSREARRPGSSIFAGRSARSFFREGARLPPDQYGLSAL
jgi:hypothetical protein